MIPQSQAFLVKPLTGQCHEIFDLYFFVLKTTWATHTSKQAKTVSRTCVDIQLQSWKFRGNVENDYADTLFWKTVFVWFYGAQAEFYFSKKVLEIS